MTANQIKAAEVFEKKRSNLVNESIGRDTLTETGRHNRAVEGETYRHNYQTELNEFSRTSETIRHNKAAEGLGYSQLAELQRHNMQGEDVAWKNLKEQNRHNIRSEKAEGVKAAGSLISSVGKVIDAFIPL